MAKKTLHSPILPWEIILIFLMVAGAYAFFLSSNPKDWNSNSRLALVKAMVEEGRLEIDSFHSSGDFATGDKAVYNDHYYSEKAPGSAIVGAIFYFPIYWLIKIFGTSLSATGFKYLITLLAVSLPSAILAPLLYLVVKKISASSELALVVTLAICLGTAFYKYSDMYFGHTLAGLFCFAAFFVWFQARSDKNFNPLAIAFSGFCIGVMFIIEYPTGLLAIPIGLYILYILWEQNRLRDWKIYALLIAGFAIPILILLSYNNAIFGSPFSLGYTHQDNVRFARAHSQGFIGIGLPSIKVLFYTTFHPTMGIFWQSPVLLLSLAGLGVFTKKSFYRPEALLAWGAIGSFTIIMSGYYMWWGGYSFTPRHLIPLFPFFGVLIAFLPKRLFKPALLLSALSIMQMLIVSAGKSTGLDVIDNMIDQGLLGRYLRNFQFPPSAIYSVYLPNVLKGEFTPNLANTFLGISNFASLFFLLGFEILIIGLFFWKIKLVAHEVD